ncbi:sensor histidine kinase [Paenibacillus hodogayensis]|uniref:histidine kinase n=1 Tax=Paenibacillus hodogayensis TaxID=279208 RepID=A0ABV5VQ35_9BACL
MKLRTYLFLSNLASLIAVLVCLFVIYHFMLLTWDDVILLMSVTLIAAVFSILVHALVIRPIVRSISNLSEASGKLAEGDFQGDVPLTGPKEFRMLAARFNAMKSQLKESIQTLTNSEKSRKELVANVSHDLRTPLASIQSYVEALQDRVIEDEADFQTYLQTIKKETVRLSRLIDDLFQLSRMDAGAYAFQPQPYPLDTLIVETLQSQSFLLEEKQLNVETRVPDDLPPVWIMPYEIQRVLGNLLQNAIHFSPVQGEIRVEARQKDGQVELIVEDQGEGIPEEEQERIFERFYRIDKSRNRYSGGAGLGLAISKSIMELHGGTIRLLRTGRPGTAFCLTLPIADHTERFR